MNALQISKIQKIPARELWRREDTHFTAWLEKNIDSLTGVLGFSIAIESREQPVGPFRVDLYGEDNNGHKVIIENQLEKTDHTHLGQILTYLVNLGVKTAIWICTDPVEEHKRVIDWLNDITPDDISFYLIQLEAIKIEDASYAAPLFTVIKGPSAAMKKIGTVKKKDSEKHTILNEFWQQFLTEFNKSSDICRNINPRSSNRISIQGFPNGIIMNLIATAQHTICAIRFTKQNKEQNKAAFDKLHAQKKQIETDFQGQLDWNRWNDWIYSAIEHKLTGVNIYNKEDWPTITKFLIDGAPRMYDSFVKRIPTIEAPPTIDGGA